MVEKILIAIDGSDHARKAVAHATDIALKHDAMIYLLYVVPKREIPREVEHYLQVEGIKEATEQEQVYYQKIGESIIEAAVKQVKGKGIRNVTSAVSYGDPVEKILQFAKEKAVDMIVLGSRGLGGVKHMFLGSVSRGVCNVADRTCVIVK